MTPLTLSAVEFEACWELLGLGETPLVLRLPSPGRTWTERRRHLAAIGAGLGEPLASALRVLAHPDRQLELVHCGEATGPLVGVGAVAGGEATLLTHRAGTIWLARPRPTALVPAVVGLLGPMSAGPGRPVSFGAAEFDAARAAATDGQLGTMADGLVARGVSRADATAWAHMCTDVRAAGQVTTGSRTIGFHATRRGHYLQQRHDGYVTVRPLDTAGLVRLTAEFMDITTSAAIR